MFNAGIGIDNFRELIELKRVYVDKTKSIKSIVGDDYPKVSLFTRPRRFGKTLTLNMLEEFFDVTKSSRELFSNLYIAKHQDICAEWMNQYPVINISLKQINKINYARALANFAIIISQICLNNNFLLNSSKVDADDRQLLEIFKRRGADETDLGQSLYVLCRALNYHFEKPCILLIDEYDVPLNYAWQHNYYQEMLDFIRDLFGFALKGNQYLKFAILTGCLRISKESIFTGVNNFKCFTISDEKYSDTFGFTKNEVENLLEMAEFGHKKAEIKAWYDGYTFGTNTEIYCPWDVINYLYDLNDNPNLPPQPYWLNSSSNDLIKNFPDHLNFDYKNKLQILLDHGAIKCTLSSDMTYENIYTSESDFWNLLYATGYLTKTRDLELTHYQHSYSNQIWLRIPNAAIETIFVNSVAKWFQDEMKVYDRKKLLQAFWSGDGQKFTEIISSILINTISFYDYHENFYHAFLIGLFSSLPYSVTSNLESGLGRVDILVMDSVQNPKRGACIELKKAENDQESLEEKALQALKQIQKNKYNAPLLYRKLSVINWGIAFYKKECLAKSQVL